MAGTTLKVKGRSAITLDALAAHLRTKSEAETTKVWHPSLSNWQAAKDVPQILERMFRPTLPPELPLKIVPPPLVEQPQSKNVDYSNARTRGRVGHFDFGVCCRSNSQHADLRQFS
jgi:hypothetical protein